LEESFMSRNSAVSNVSRRRFLVASTVAATSSFVVGKDSNLGQPVPTPPSPPVHYLVTIDVTTDPISYTAENKDTLTGVPMPNNSLTVNKGDEVKWQAKTAGPNAKHRGHIRFTTTTPFAVKEFRWSENGFGGGYTKNAGTHYYCVGVFDKLKQEVYADDPKIIVGGTFDAKAEVEEAESEVREVKEKIESIENLLKKAIEKL
jgi:hypothetical protein